MGIDYGDGMGKPTILFIGRQQTLETLEAYQDIFKYEGYDTLEATSFADVKKILASRTIDVILVYAYGSQYSDEIDLYTGELPQIVYWRIPLVDAIPAKRKVVSVTNTTLPSELIAKVNELLNR